MKFNEIVARNAAEVEFDSTSEILRAMLHAIISIVATRCNLPIVCNIARNVASCNQPSDSIQTQRDYSFACTPGVCVGEGGGGDTACSPYYKQKLREAQRSIEKHFLQKCFKT